MAAEDVADNVVQLPVRKRREWRAPLTAASIKALKAKDAAYEVTDTGCRGLTLRVTGPRLKVFRWRWRQRLPGARAAGEVVTIGPWAEKPEPGHVTLQEARLWVDRLKAARELGGAAVKRVEADLVATVRPKAREVVGAPKGPTVGDMAERFFTVMDGQRKRPEAVRYVMEKDILPALGAIPLLQLRKSDCVAVIDRVVKRDAAVHAGKVLGILKQFLSFVENIEDDFVSPAARLKAANLGVQNNVKDRWLAEAELVAFWRACETAESFDYEPPDEQLRLTLRLLLLTAVRTGELRLARWADVDLEARLWTVPVAHQKLTLAQAKQGRAFVIPLTDTAVALFTRLKEFTGDSEQVLPKYRERRRGQVTDAVTLDEKTVGKAMLRMWRGDARLKALEPATPHDLRRSCRTWLGKLGVAPHVAERCLNHSLPRIQKTYDQGDYLEERRAALEKWDAFLLELRSRPS